MRQFIVYKKKEKMYGNKKKAMNVVLIEKKKAPAPKIAKLAYMVYTAVLKMRTKWTSGGCINVLIIFFFFQNYVISG